MIKKIKFSLLGLIITMPSFATYISTQQIVQSALSTSCTEYKIAGTCFWLFCSYGCKIRTSVKVKHYIPDVVMSTYEQPFKNPWTEINTITSSASSLVGSNIQGGGDTNNQSSFQLVAYS